MDSLSFDLLNEEHTFGIEYRKFTDRGSMSSNHYHGHYEIYYQMAGERYYFIKDRTYYIKKGDIVFINMYDLHKTIYAGADFYERVLINFKARYIKGFLDDSKDIDLFSVFSRDINVYSLSLTEQGFIESLLNKMLQENQKSSIGYGSYLKISLIEILIFLNRLSLNPQTRSLEYPSALHKKISEVAKYINNNFFNNITLNDLSQVFHVSPFYLSRTFKKVTGFTFIEYLNSTRIKEAQRLLLKSNLSVTDIGEKVGFESTTHFGRVFKNISNASPLQYRKLHSK
jgi:AraC-like DNA-binding protein/quercetin dioxygenase-like cupin family protein